MGIHSDRAFRGLALLPACMLAACGGGGGGSSSSATASLTADNALEITREVFATTQLEEGFAASLAGGFVSAVSAGGRVSRPALENAQYIARVVAPQLFPAAPLTASATQSVSCDFGGIVNISANDAGTRITAEFSACRGLGGEPLLAQTTINGELKINVAANTSQRVDIKLDFTAFEIIFGVDTATLNGDFRQIIEEGPTASQGLRENRVSQLLIDDLLISENNFSRRLQNYDLQVQRQTGLALSGFEQSDLTGSLNIPRFGSVNFTSDVPFVLEFSGQNPAGSYTQGVLQIDGAEGSGLRVSAATQQTDVLRGVLDANGNGATELVFSVPGRDILVFDSIY